MQDYRMSVSSNVFCRFERCREVAQVLNRMYVPVPKESVPPLPLNPAEEANFWFFLAAICHQTSPIGLPALEGVIEGAFHRGWDYLVHAFRVASVRDRTLLSPARWQAFTDSELCAVFTDLLCARERRLVLIRDLGERLYRRRWNSILEAGEHCEYYVRDHSPNLLGVLSGFAAYSDPVEKKSVFFLALMRNSGVWRYADEEKLPAPVDYHEVRGHLRIGTVGLRDELRHKVSEGVPTTSEEDIALRMAVREAIQEIAVAVGNSPNALHYLFWNLFRTYCIRTTPLCDGSEFAKLPNAYAKSVESNGSRECPFSSVCDSAFSARAIDEHKVVTDFY